MRLHLPPQMAQEPRQGGAPAPRSQTEKTWLRYAPAACLVGSAGFCVERQKKHLWPVCGTPSRPQPLVMPKTENVGEEEPENEARDEGDEEEQDHVEFEHGAEDVFASSLDSQPESSGAHPSTVELEDSARMVLEEEDEQWAAKEQDAGEENRGMRRGKWRRTSRRRRKRRGRGGGGRFGLARRWRKRCSRTSRDVAGESSGWARGSTA